ncbi:Nitrogen fixation protein rnfC [Aedoeadaptatus ivorii]|uniref:Nitrogen fixation protein rnfC n=1 Tax=Aedoeadaptatus ivorii TaxID=54006 RepID=A0A3S4ZPY3_9FIRM|nr:proline reductase-associated electron transfer protein PrdC [Peptoniphilus ivorii]MDQ0507982.1 proline reductase-associated electron transfer protein PrdC [Peptoniphilus ivorii]VEJ34825.1 Nitrogen fixation protein rnfC [Peptoniphilus ivorii]
MGKEFKFFLKQGVGAPPEPVVEKGDSVKRGQVIADYDPEKLSVPLHSSVNGKVKEVHEDYILVEQGDKSDDFIKLEPGKDDAETVRKAGILGMGGAGFPAYVKMGTKLEEGGYILCNAAECEPILEHNMLQIMEETEALIGGIQIAMKSTGAAKGIIGIKLKHKEEIKHINKFLKEKGIKDIRCLPLRNVYPVGEERALVRDTVNVLLEPGALPAAANCVVFNVETLCAIYEAVEHHKPMIDKYVTVAGKFKKFKKKGEKEIIHIPYGMMIEDIIEDFGGIDEPIGEILIGGPYTGRRMLENSAVYKLYGGITAVEPFAEAKGPLGIIQCACGPAKERLYEIAQSLGQEPIGYRVCKNAVEQNNGTYKCKDPGNCPGQAEHVLHFKKEGANSVLIGHCTDCSNTVMGSAPKAGLEVHHATDAALRTMGMPVIRKYDESQL